MPRANLLSMIQIKLYELSMLVEKLDKNVEHLEDVDVLCGEKWINIFKRVLEKQSTDEEF